VKARDEAGTCGASVVTVEFVGTVVPAVVPTVSEWLAATAAVVTIEVEETVTQFDVSLDWQPVTSTVSWRD
jgi:hypothetical protein